MPRESPLSSRTPRNLGRKSQTSSVWLRLARPAGRPLCSFRNPATPPNTCTRSHAGGRAVEERSVRGPRAEDVCDQLCKGERARPSSVSVHPLTPAVILARPAYRHFMGMPTRHAFS